MVFAVSGHVGLRVGLTGGIGVGKSEVATRFATRGVPIVDADIVARQVVEPGQPALARLVNLCGLDVVNHEGRLERSKLRDLIFSNTGLRRQVEQILHPVIRLQMEIEASRAVGPYCILVVPLLLEAHQRDMVDRVLVVDCPSELQRQRVMLRDNLTAPNADAIMRSQVDRSERLRQADDIIINDGDFQTLEAQVETLHNRYLVLSKSS